MTPDDKYFESSEFKSKLEYYEQCIEAGRSPFMDPDDLTDIADYYNYTWEPEKADEAIELAMELHPGATMPLVFKVRESMMFGQYKEAEEYISQIENKDDPEVCYVKAELLIAQGKLDEADIFLEQNYQRQDIDSQQDFIIDAAMIWDDFQHYDRAISWTMRLDPRHLDVEALELIARIHFGLKHYDESIKIYESIIDKKPFSMQTWYALASAQLMNDNLEDAEKSIDFALAIKPDNQESMLLKGNILSRMEKFDKAIDTYERYQKIAPNDMMTYINLATCYYATDNINKAREMALKALKAIDYHDKDVALQACEQLVLLDLEQNNVEEANKWVEMAEQISEYAEEPLMLKAHILLYQRRLQEALNMFQDAIELSPNKRDVIMRMLASLFDNGYRKLGIIATRYYCNMDNVTEEDLENMTPEELIAYIKQNLETKW